MVVGAAIAFLAVGALHDARLVGWRELPPVRVWPLLGGTLLEVLLLGWGVLLWSRILAAFDGPRPSYRALLRVWCGSTLAKYVPGSVWSVATTAEMATRVGASPLALPSSFLLQGALNGVGAVTLAAIVHAGAGSPAGGTVAGAVPPWLAAALLAGALVLVHPSVINALVRCGARAARRSAPTWNGTWAGGALLLLLYVATWAAYGVAFALVLSSVAATTGHVAWATLAGMNALAFVAGFVAFFAPGGLGVREAALVALLAPVLPARGTRIAVAAFSRLWLVATEVIGGSVALAVNSPTRRRARRSPTAPPRPTVAPTSPPPPAPSDDVGVVRGVDVELLTDSRAALVAITAACRAATQTIWIAQLAFDADCVATEASDGREPQPLLDAILEAAGRRDDVAAARGTERAPVDVRIVLNGGLLLDTAPALRRAIAERRGGANVRVRTVRAFPQVMHAKMLVVDGRDAFLMGSSFVNGYWDDARHVAAGDPSAAPGAGDRPLHDVAVRLRSPAAGAVLAHWFASLWASAEPAAGETGGAEPVVPDTARRTADGTDDGRAAVRVLRTTPGAPTAAGGGRTEILDAYLEAIDRATECIYLESQYFSARPIARAVRSALDAHHELELILVLNQNPDVTGYRAWQDARLADHGLLAHPRVGVFALWSTAPSRGAPGRAEVTQQFVHSKVAVIDDAWATLGTANLDGASLHSYGDDFVRWPGRRAFGGYRNYDLNVALLDGVGGEARTGVAGTLRRRLWARHLGVPEQDLHTRPAHGWLPLWRARAAENVARIAAGAAPPPRGRALPYVPLAHPRAQLRSLGIDPDASGLELRFDPGPLEVRYNLGWIEKTLPEWVRRWL